MAELAVFAEALRYPAPGRLERLKASLPEVAENQARGDFAAFLKAVESLSLGAWEELHTSTLDLNPEVAPYLGFQMWGDSYKRGNFMSKMSRALGEQGVDTEGELPDHLAPVLRYLDAVAEPLPDLQEILEPALQKMMESLRKKDASNPYMHLLRAIAYSCNHK